MRKKSTGSASGSCSGRNNCHVRNDCFAAETEGTKAEGGNITIAETADPQNINPLYVVDQTSFDMMQALYSPFLRS